MGKRKRNSLQSVQNLLIDSEEESKYCVNTKNKKNSSNYFMSTNSNILSKKNKKFKRNNFDLGIINSDYHEYNISSFENGLNSSVKKKISALKGNSKKLSMISPSTPGSSFSSNSSIKKKVLSNGHKNVNKPENTNNFDFKDIVKQRKGLPIFSSRNEVISEIVKSETIIIIGETGSGKTTQIPQFLHEERFDKKGAICITQPRRIAAITVAKRVAEEMNSEVGNVVGYSVRFEDCSSKTTKLKFVTDGMLLREALRDPLFTKYQWIILDEAHERSINTDILFGVVKEAQRKRKLKKRPLNIIVMSATMDVDHFSSYFNGAPVLYIKGRQHPVKIFVTKKKYTDYTVATLSTMLKIHKEANPDEDILIFLTGQEEIDSAVKLINYISKDSKLSTYPTLKAYPLYAALPHNKQLKVFKHSLPGERKIIVSTNIAETSVTIPGIKYVIDCGHAKVRTYNSTSGFDELKVCKISQAQAWQRTGRAGREAPGFCYRTYTDEDFDSMKLNTVPEILRANLASVLLKLLAVGVKKIMKFQFIDMPSMTSLKEAKSDLIDLKAVEYADGRIILTELGSKMTIFPLEPQYAKLLLNSSEYSCTEEILTIIAILSSESVLINSSEKRDDANDKRAKFAASEGDHISLLNIYKGFVDSSNPKAWCRKNFLNFRNLSYAANVRRQLRELCERNYIPLVSCERKPEPILRCLISALYKNIAECSFGSKYKILRSGEFARIHPSSCLFGRSPEYILFTEVVRTERTYMHIVSEIKAEWMMEFDSEYFISKHIRKTSS